MYKWRLKKRYSKRLYKKTLKYKIKVLMVPFKTKA